MKTKKLSFAIVCLLTITMLQLYGGKTDVTKKRFEVDPSKQAVINFIDIDGNVIVETHNKNEILFTFEKELKGGESRRRLEYFEEVQPEIDFENNRLDIEINYPRRRPKIFGIFSLPSIKVNSRLVVPVNTDIKIKVVDGNINVSGLTGNVVLRSVDGDLTVKQCRGSMKLCTVDGGIDVNRCSGALSTQTTDGDVTASGVFTGVYFRSVDGEGTFTFQEGSQLKGDCLFRTVDGDIRLTFAEELDFKLQVKTGDGRIDMEGMEFKNVTMKKRNRFNAEHGDAHYTIELKTIDGNVSLEKF
jgi:DUF4097 and DUF4098 domain-containing protein YvlB